MRSRSGRVEAEETDMKCFCNGTGWVCADHPNQEWNVCTECKPVGAAEGAPCICNPDASMPPGTVIIRDIDRGKLN